MSTLTAQEIFSISSQVRKHSLIVFFLIVGLVLVGCTGYMIIENWSFLDSLYMTIITITTVGLQEVKKLSPEGRVFTIFVIVAGVSTWAYAVSVFSRLIIEGDIKKFFINKRLKKMIRKLSDHTILCGFGRIGQIVAREFEIEKTPFLVIEKNPRREDELKQKGYLHIIGDATDEAVLKSAGIENAKCMLSVLGTDASNVYAILIARDLNARLYIVGRSEDTTSEDNIIRAGADKVISPYRIGARGLAQAATRPHILNFIEVATSTRNMELAIEEILVPGKSPLLDQTLLSANIRGKFGVFIIGSKNRNQEMIFNPPADYPIKAGEVLIAMGKRESLTELRKAIS